MASLHGDSLGAESDTLNMVGKPQRVTWKCWTWTSHSAVRKRCDGGIGGCSESLNAGAAACRQGHAKRGLGTHRNVWAAGLQIGGSYPCRGRGGNLATISISWPSRRT